MPNISPTQLRAVVTEIVERTPIVDIHTHLYSPAFGDLLLWGVDELLTYHYLVAEIMRRSPVGYDEFWALSTREKANHIWEYLYRRSSPISEAARGVLTALQTVGIDISRADLEEIRQHFKQWTVQEYADLVFQKANVEFVVMTNDPFDSRERAVWEREIPPNPQFRAALRIDPLLTDLPRACSILSELGYAVSTHLDDVTCAQIRRFLRVWIDRMDPLYMAVSLPPTFCFPTEDPVRRMLDSCILPVALDREVPLALMIGVKRQVNPHLQLAGDSVGKAGTQAIENLCVAYPDNRFLVTMLSREDQHLLCVTARKFRNLMPFGCWWFLNVPSLIREVTMVRLELLGFSFIPQHSDARILDQLLYKWAHSRKVIAEVLVEKYTDLQRTGWSITEEAVTRDVRDLFRDNFLRFAGRL
ncbi:MAG TPA: glucuronate isomerase [bacterium]|nr:glucuronate isomerase [bacterium]HQL62164.1 glucuronate isomerase [bacterium]